MEGIEDKKSIRTKYLIDLKDYESGPYVNHGSYGDVFKIINKTTRKEYAVKFLSEPEEQYDKLKINREIGIMIRLQHPTLIRFVGYSLKDFKDQDCVAIIMEYAKNGSLHDVLKKNQKVQSDVSFDNTAKQKILIGVAYAMMYLHHNHVIHRDLKPSNVVLDEFYHPHLTDFGTSKFTRPGHALEQTGARGSLLYMAPEVMNHEEKIINGKKVKIVKYDEKADVYSFAILMFEVVNNKIHYSKLVNIAPDDFPAKVIRDKMRPEFTVPVKESIKLLITQCWDDNPNKRPTFDEIFNKLAFNLDDSVYDVFEEDDEYKYYLDGVNVDEIFDYVYEIAENTDTNPKIERLMRDSEELKRENTSIKKKIEHQNQMINDLITENKKMKEELEQTKSLLDQIKDESIGNKKETKQTEDSVELKPIIDPNEDKKDTNQTKNAIEPSVTEIDQSEDMLDLIKRETIQIKNKCDSLTEFDPAIYIGGCDKFCQFDTKEHKVNEYGDLYIYPPQKMPPFPSCVQSYSIYSYHSVGIDNKHQMIGFGSNQNGSICSLFKKPLGATCDKFSITDSNGNMLVPISAVCCSNSTLYMCSKSSGKGRQLILCHSDIDEGHPIFLDIGDQDPVALYGGSMHAAAISSEGKIIFIESASIKKSPESAIAGCSLPDGEKASCVAFMDNKYFILSSNGKVFSSRVTRGIGKHMFSYVEQLQNEEIVYLSGTKSHVLAVTRDGRVFGCGSNEHGKLGFNKKRGNFQYFTEIKALKRMEISAAYAGANHSLFVTREGKILSCGDNRYGQLFLKDKSCMEVCTPSHSIIKSGATFCIAGEFVSAVFIGCYPPIYTPNTKIEFPE